MNADPTQITPQGLTELKAELEELEGPRRREISERIKTARDFGDLKENSEYHDAKNEQAFLETKIMKLRERLTTAVVADEKTTAAGKAAFGSQVKLRDEESGKEVTYRLVGATEANLADGKLSIESPVAQAMVGRKAGDEVVVATPRGGRRYSVIAVD
jgi:transcription elongation factor GreA